MICLILFPVLHWECGVSLPRSTVFPVSSVIRVISLQVRSGFPTFQTSSSELSFQKTHQRCLLTKLFRTMFCWHQRMFRLSLWALNPLRMNLILIFGLLHWKKETKTVWRNGREPLWSISCLWVKRISSSKRVKGPGAPYEMTGIESPWALWPQTCSNHLFLWQWVEESLLYCKNNWLEPLNSHQSLWS